MSPSYDFASMQPQLPALSTISSANIAIADILGQQRKEIENLALGNVREIAKMEEISKDQLNSEFFLLSQYTSIGDISSATGENYLRNNLEGYGEFAEHPF